MDSPQSVVSPFKVSSESADPEKQKETKVQSKETMGCNLEGSIGVLEVYIHQARDIHNICIYHKQDVYAKICLTSDPEYSLSTQTINGGGKNPVFNENLRLDVRKLDCSLKCEIWMLSRVRNYLEDQLLGFALVPLSEVLIKNGKLEKEFSLSSTDLFHSPAGFVQLSLSYSGASPEIMVVSASAVKNIACPDSEVTESVSNEFGKIEFPDPQVVNENDRMVSEYFALPCTNLDSQTSESPVSSDAKAQHSSEIGVQVVESLEANELVKHDPSPSSISSNGASKFTNQEPVSPSKESLKDKREEIGHAISNASSGTSVNTFVKPVISVNIEPEQKVVQQEIVDMYMKSMQQFTESLAKMKLPMDIESGPPSSEDSSSDQKLQMPKNDGTRVFYGSRAFF